MRLVLLVASTVMTALPGAAGAQRRLQGSPAREPAERATVTAPTGSRLPRIEGGRARGDGGRRPERPSPYRRRPTAALGWGYLAPSLAECAGRVGLVWGWSAAGPACDGPGDRPTSGPSPRVPPTRVIDVAAEARAIAAAGTGGVAVEWVEGGAVRLRWSGDAASAREVSLVVADSARRPLASRVVSAPGFEASFAVDPHAAFVGASVVRADGSSTLTLTPLGPPQTRRD